MKTQKQMVKEIQSSLKNYDLINWLITDIEKGRKKKRIEQRSLARKKKGSNHYQKQKIIISLLHEHIKNQRQDYLHKISRYLVDNYDTI